VKLANAICNLQTAIAMYKVQTANVKCNLQTAIVMYDVRLAIVEYKAARCGGITITGDCKMLGSISGERL
jgi:hypothetical protein